jgi:hypothetical protein
MESLNTIQNIRFSYMYRDAGNYKERGFVIFSNPSDYSIDKLEKSIRNVLIDQLFFIPSECRIPLVHTFFFDPDLDHEWYELEEIELTPEPVTDKRSIDTFIKICTKSYEAYLRNLHPK